jgi:hypothetical protein
MRVLLHAGAARIKREAVNHDQSPTLEAVNHDQSPNLEAVNHDQSPTLEAVNHDQSPSAIIDHKIA